MNRQKFSDQIVETFMSTGERRPRLFWRLLVYMFLFMLVLGTAQHALVSLDERELPLPQTIGGGFYLIVASTGIIGVTALSRRFLDRRPWRGIALTNIWKGIPQTLLGWLIGCVLIALIFAVEYVLGWVRIEGNEVATSGWNFVWDWLVGGLLLDFTVGVIFQNLGEQCPIWLATLITGFLFAIVHGSLGLGYFIGVVLISTFLIITRLATRSLWFAIAFHGGWNWMQSQVLGIMYVNTPGYHHALLHLSQHGPAFFVGRAPEIEGGLIPIVLMVVAISGAWFYVRRAQPAVDWNVYLSSTGEPIPAERAGAGRSQE
jgi:membrane protease YdiL (CAAX protease family)